MRRPLRVLMTADTVGGVFSYALELIAALGDRAEVHLVTMGNLPSRAQRAAVEALEGVELHPSAFRLEWMDDPWAEVEEAGAWLLELERELSPEVVHLNGYVHAAFPFAAPTLVVGHSCVMSWFDQVQGSEPPPSFDRYRHEVTRGLRAAGRVIAPTATMLGWLQRFYGPLRSSRCIFNGRRALAEPGRKEPLVMSAGRLWDQAKNLETLARAAPRMPWPVLVAGSTRSPDGAEQSVQGVEHLGELSPSVLGSWLSRASVFALPARYEPFGLGPLEAALAGCALVLGDIPSLREVWAEAAWYVPPDDDRALAEAVSELAVDQGLRARLASAARRRAKRYTPAAMAEGYLDEYVRLTQPPQEATSSAQGTACAS